MRECWQYSRKVLGSECLQALRTHADKLIIAKLISIEAAGLYYFAFNAGVGITTGLVNAFALVLAARDLRRPDARSRCMEKLAALHRHDLCSHCAADPGPGAACALVRAAGVRRAAGPMQCRW